MDLHENLKGKTVVITGGSGILCREFAYAYAKQGMNVAVLGRTLSKLEEVRDKINELGGNGLAVVCDVVDKDSVINAKKVVNDTFGKVDILVNGAGGNHPKGTTTKEYFEKGDIENPNVVSFFDLSKENFNYVFDLNIVGTLIPTQVFIVDMLDNPGANVLNIAVNEFVPRNYKSKRILCRKSRYFQLYRMACRTFCKKRYQSQRSCTGLV